jgi:hypothetical protein
VLNNHHKCARNGESGGFAGLPPVIAMVFGKQLTYSRLSKRSSAKPLLQKQICCVAAKNP